MPDSTDYLRGLIADLDRRQRDVYIIRREHNVKPGASLLDHLKHCACADDIDDRNARDNGYIHPEFGAGDELNPDLHPVIADVLRQRNIDHPERLESTLAHLD